MQNARLKKTFKLFDLLLGKRLQLGKINLNFERKLYNLNQNLQNYRKIINLQAPIFQFGNNDLQSLNCKDFNYLLTWFDKLRIGLWLSSIYMIENFFGIKPHFYINSGAYTKDRILLILIY